MAWTGEPAPEDSAPDPTKFEAIERGIGDLPGAPHGQRRAAR